METINQIKSWLRSDTIKTLAIMFLLNGIQGTFPIMPEWLIQLSNIILPLVAARFRINLKTSI